MTETAQATTPDLGAARALDLEPAALRSRAWRRRLVGAAWLVGGLGVIAALFALWPEVWWEPRLQLPSWVGWLGLAGMGASLLVSLGGAPRTFWGGAPDHDPLRDLRRADAAWVRARVAAAAPVPPEHEELVADAARWLAEERYRWTSSVGQLLLGLGLLLTVAVPPTLPVAALLLAQGVRSLWTAHLQAPPARRWLDLYAPGDPA